MIENKNIKNNVKCDGYDNVMTNGGMFKVAVQCKERYI